MNRNYVRKATRKSSRIHNHQGGFIPVTGAMLTHKRRGAEQATKHIQGMYNLSRIIHRMNYAYMRKGNE